MNITQYDMNSLKEFYVIIVNMLCFPFFLSILITIFFTFLMFKPYFFPTIYSFLEDVAAY